MKIGRELYEYGKGLHQFARFGGQLSEQERDFVRWWQLNNHRARAV